MKTVTWQGCLWPGAIGTYPPTTGKMLGPIDSVTPGMNVTGRYNDLIVSLQIKSEVSEGKFLATVLSFDPVLASRPGDLAEDDDVLIDREYICFRYGA
jgi:hypothetical protein